MPGVEGQLKRLMVNEIALTGGQIRAARGFLRWSAEVLAQRSRVGLSTVKRAEAVDGAPPITPANLDAIRRALETAGIAFVGEAGGPGVCVRQSGMSVGLPPERRRVGPEDETRSGPEASERPAAESDD